MNKEKDELEREKEVVQNKIDEISIKLRRNYDEKFKEKALYIINEKSNEIGYHFSLYV